MTIPTTSTATNPAVNRSPQSSQTESPELANAKQRVEKDEGEVERANKWLLCLLAVYLLSNLGIAGATFWIYRANKRLRVSDGVVSALYQERAASAEKELLELKETLSFQRNLEQKPIWEALRQQPKGIVTIIYIPDDPEAERLASLFDSTLFQIGWTIRGKRIGRFDLWAVQGTLLAVGSASIRYEDWPPQIAAFVLAVEKQAPGIVGYVRSESGLDIAPKDELVIYVGKKY